MGLFLRRMLDKTKERDCKMKKYFDYLDGLRESGVTNMFEAASYLQQEFPELSFDHAKAVQILRAWMDSRRKGGDGSC